MQNDNSYGNGADKIVNPLKNFHLNKSSGTAICKMITHMEMVQIRLTHSKSGSSLYHMALFINLMRLNYITETYISVPFVHSFSADTTTRRWKIQFKIFWDSCEYREIR